MTFEDRLTGRWNLLLSILSLPGVFLGAYVVK